MKLSPEGKLRIGVGTLVRLLGSGLCFRGACESSVRRGPSFPFSCCHSLWKIQAPSAEMQPMSLLTVTRSNPPLDLQRTPVLLSSHANAAAHADNPPPPPNPAPNPVPNQPKSSQASTTYVSNAFQNCSRMSTPQIRNRSIWHSLKHFIRVRPAPTVSRSRLGPVSRPRPAI